MRIIKKLDIFILKQFCLLFAGTFFICLFILMMQFLWRYVDDLIGKGLPFEVWVKFFFYASMTLVPLSLPLALLLASLISFGNMGERLELLAMKAAGIPLLRILQPVMVVSVIVAAGSFYFQNVIAPESSKQLAALLYSTKQKSPEMEIPEGIFYNEIPGYNLFVQRKDIETGMLYGILIYTQGRNFDDTQVVMADSGRMQTTAEQMHLKLTLYDGRRFRNMQNTGNALDHATVPYMRETFLEEVDLIPFDNNFSVMDAELFNGNAQTKNLEMLTRGIDSISGRLDSMGLEQFKQYSWSFLQCTHLNGRSDSAKIIAAAAKADTPFDTIFARLTDNERSQSARVAVSRAQAGQTQTTSLQDFYYGINRTLRIHMRERHKKFSLALACIIFFFIGAPLGAIIRKGGLGVPVVVSVVIFIIYYMINALGEKLAETGKWETAFGLWLSTALLTPVGIWLTVKANKDSTVFNMEAYIRFFRRLLGLRERFYIVARKEIVMEEPDYARLIPELQTIAEDSTSYLHHHHLLLMPSYFSLFFRYEPDTEVTQLSDRLDAAIEELGNERDIHVIALLNRVPKLIPDAHTRPFRTRKMNMAVGLFFPAGIVMWLRIWRYRILLARDLNAMPTALNAIIGKVSTLQGT